MKKRLAKAALAALLAGAVASAAAWYITSGGAPGSMKAKSTGSAWIQPFLEGLAVVGVANGLGDYELVSQEGRWSVALPGLERKVPADQGRVAGLIDFVANHSPNKRLFLMRPGQAADWGLDDPSASLTLTGGKGNLFTLMLGNRRSDGSGVYGLSSLEQDMLLIMDPAYGDQLGRSADHYFDMRPLRLAPDEVVRVSLSREFSPGWTAERRDRGEGGFVFTAPPAIEGRRVSASAMGLYLHNLVELKATRFLTGEQEGGSLDDPCLTINVRDEKGRDMALSAYGTPPGQGYRAASSMLPFQFTLDRDQVDQLNKRAFSLSDRTVVDLDLGRLELMKVSRTGEELTLSKEGNLWFNEADGQLAVGTDTLLWRLNRAKFQSEPGSGLSAEARRELVLELFDDDGDRLAELAFFTDKALPPGLVWLVPSGGRGPYPVKESLLGDLIGWLPPGRPEH